MYFQSRAQAGQKLSEQIVLKYQSQPCTVVALDDGGAVVGAQIALRLNCVMAMLLSEQIELPRENTAVAGISQDGMLSYNTTLSQGEVDEIVSEYHSVIEQEKIAKISEMHRNQGRGTLIRRDLLHGRNVIVVSDGLQNGFLLDLAADYLKHIHIKRLVVATPLASVQAVDRMHILADEIFCLSVVEYYINTNHYYDAQDVPSHEQIIKGIEKIIANWRPS